MRARLALLLFALAAAAACVNGIDARSHVHDLRVLGVQVDPPELMFSPDGGGCLVTDPAALAAAAIPVWSQQVTYKALIADPDGGGRLIHYDLWACGDSSDLTCYDGGHADLVPPGETTTDGGVDTELTLRITPGPAIVDGGFVLFQVFQNDPYRGLGGVLMPIVLHLKADNGEEIYAQKLMTFSCQWFPDMQANQNPVLRSFYFVSDAGAWPAGGGPVAGPDGGCGPDGGQAECAEGVGSYHVWSDPIPNCSDVADAGLDCQESYAVPAFDLSEVHLTESWMIDWYATEGTFGPDETGGTGLNGEQDPHTTAWTTGNGDPESDVWFWFVVRDGRGGESWQKRFLHYIP